MQNQEQKDLRACSLKVATENVQDIGAASVAGGMMGGIHTGNPAGIVIGAVGAGLATGVATSLTYGRNVNNCMVDRGHISYGSRSSSSSSCTIL